jgi:hypothetical protein
MTLWAVLEYSSTVEPFTAERDYLPLEGRSSSSLLLFFFVFLLE